MIQPFPRSGRADARSRSLILCSNVTAWEFPLRDLHLHTSWTDGKNSVAEMYQRSVSLGLNCILFSEHVSAHSDVWYSEFASEVRSLPESSCTALVGAEARIADFEGRITVPGSILKQCDLITASVHRFPGRDGAEYASFSDYLPEAAVDTEFKLMSAALDNAEVDILGHPFGMSFRQYKMVPSKSQVEELVHKAAENEVAIEINSYYNPDPFEWIAICRKYGAFMAFGSDAHDVDSVGTIMRVLNGEEMPWKI